MQILKACVIALLIGFFALQLKQANKPFACILSATCCIMLFWMGLLLLQDILTQFESFLSTVHIQKEHIVCILKLMGIAYLVEFTGKTLKDLGQEGLSMKISFLGKITMAGILLPLIKDVYTLIFSLV